LFPYREAAGIGHKSSKSDLQTLALSRWQSAKDSKHRKEEVIGMSKPVVAKNHIIKVTEDYIYKWGNHRDVLRHPTKKKIAELNAVGGEDWYRSFLEPETLARMGK